jgi:hypothetical protein
MASAARTAIIAARQARPQFIRKPARNMLSVGPLLADRNVRAHASSKPMAANRSPPSGFYRLACFRGQRRSRRLAQQRVERPVRLLGEIDIKLAKLARLDNKVLI